MLSKRRTLWTVTAASLLLGAWLFSVTEGFWFARYREVTDEMARDLGCPPAKLIGIVGDRAPAEAVRLRVYENRWTSQDGMSAINGGAVFVYERDDGSRVLVEDSRGIADRL